MSADLEVARRWAAALDSDDFDALPGFLSPVCVYHSPGGDLVGPEAIVTSYRESSEWAHATFDRIAWDSEWKAEDDGRVRFTFIDITDHQGQHHVYRCQQLIRLDDDGLIEDIEHVAIEEEERRLAEFLDRVGVRRRTSS